MKTEPDWLNPCEPTDVALIQNLQQHAAKQASLYAAAPELLEALKAIMDYCGPIDPNCPDGPDCESCRLANAAHAAIAKAEGRAQ